MDLTWKGEFYYLKEVIKRTLQTIVATPTGSNRGFWVSRLYVDQWGFVVLLVVLWISGVNGFGVYWLCDNCV